MQLGDLKLVVEDMLRSYQGRKLRGVWGRVTPLKICHFAGQMYIVLLQGQLTEPRDIVQLLLLKIMFIDNNFSKGNLGHTRILLKLRL